MDMYQAISAVQNPQAILMQYAMQGMIAQHPDQWKKAQQQFANKNHEQMLAELRELYKQKGMDLSAVAKQWGINI